MYAAGVDTVPTVTTTGWRPDGTFDGTTKLICVTPTSPLGIPTNGICGEAIPPTVTVTASVGFGNCARGVSAEGEVPSARLGVTCPSPVMYRKVAWPALAVRFGVVALLPSRNVKMPGAIGDTLKK